MYITIQEILVVVERTTHYEIRLSHVLLDIRLIMGVIFFHYIHPIMLSLAFSTQPNLHSLGHLGPHGSDDDELSPVYLYIYEQCGHSILQQ